MKKVLCIILGSIIFLTSCAELSPIPTSQNNGGILGTVQDALNGKWDRFKKKDKNQKYPANTYEN